MRRVPCPRRRSARRAPLALGLLEPRTTPSLVAAYAFDEGARATLTDLSGAGNNGAVANAAWTSAGKYGGALQFTGATNSLVTVPESAALDLTTGMTLEAWVRPTSLASPDNGWCAAIAKDHQNSNNDIAYALYAANGTGTPPATHVLRSSSDVGVQGTAVLPLNAWTFLAGTFNGSTLAVYVNGALAGSRSVSGSIAKTADALRIGGDWSGEMFTGLIDNVRIYNTALTQAQIQADMNTPLVSAPDSQPPAVSITAPANNSTVAGTMTVTASATDNVAVAGVQFRLDGANLGSPVTASPYSISWNSATVADGPHTLTAVATDTSNNAATSAPVSVTVSNTDTQPPTAPKNLSAAGTTGRASLSWTAATDNVAVTQYNVYRSTTSGFAPSPSTRVGTSGGTSYTDSVAAGTYYYLVTAQDAAGSESAPSNEANAVVPADTAAPTVSISSPSNGATVSGSVTVTASASDNVAVARVQFAVDGTPLGSPDTAAPYQAIWDTTGAANGVHTVTATATDTSGNAATATIQVTVSNATANGNLTVDGSQRYQQFDGFGTNLNSAAWGDGDVRPALDTLLNVMGANLFRVIVEPCSGWEDTNPNTAPYSTSNPNWAYYNQVYSSPKFTNLWNTISYLNAHNAKVLLNIQGYPPAWMRNADYTMPVSHEDDWVTMVTTMLYYAVNTAHVRVDYFGPMNEPDNSSDPVQGPQVQAAQYTDMMHRLVVSMQSYGLGGIPLVGPDTAQVAQATANYMPAMIADGTLMPQVYHFGIHSYDGSTGSTNSVVQGSGWPGRNFWVDEYATTPSVNWDQGQPIPASQEWDFSRRSFENLLSDLNQGAAGATVWDGVDSFYLLENNWSTGGQLAYDQATQTYTPRLRLYANGTADRFLLPGDYRVRSTTSLGINQLASYNPATGHFALVGDNFSGGGVTITGSLTGGITASTLQVYFTTSDGSKLLQRQADVAVNGSTFSLQVPNGTIFGVTTPIIVDTQPPTAPTNLNASTGNVGSVALSWTAANDNTGVTGYKVYRATSSGVAPSAATLIGQTAATTYTDNVPAGTYYYQVTAVDGAGNESPLSNEAAGTSAADTVAPSVNITAPATGATVSGAVTVSANASDNVAVASVQFFVDGTSVGTATTAPYSVIWNTASWSNAAHTLTAVATDPSGNSATSAPVTVTVNNTATGLVAAYYFDEGSGTTVKDVSGHGNNGTLTNATWTAAGKFGGALVFSGSLSSVVTVPDSAALHLGTGMTLEAWVNPSSLASPDSGWCAAVAKDRQNSNNDVAYALYAAAGSRTPPAGHVLVGSADYGANGAAVLPLNTWTYLAATYDGATLRMYVNGTQAGTRTIGGSIFSTADPLRIGGDWSGEMFTGAIDNVRIYDRALSAAEIQADMTSALSGGGGGPLAAVALSSPAGSTGAGPAPAGMSLGGLIAAPAYPAVPLTAAPEVGGAALSDATAVDLYFAVLPAKKPKDANASDGAAPGA